MAGRAAASGGPDSAQKGQILGFDGGGRPYVELVARIDALLARHFTLVETVRAGGDHVFRLYRRNTA
jgi:hypothetical protein